MASNLTVESFVHHFDEYASNTRDARQYAERDRDYYDHKQLTEKQVLELKKRKQAPVVINRIQPKVNFMLGRQRAARTDIKAFPRTPNHQEAAEPITDALRYVADNVNFDNTSSDCFERLIIEGTEGAIVEYNPQKDQIEINFLNWDRVYWDIHSRRLDFSDSRRFGIVIWKDIDVAKSMFPDKQAMIDEMVESEVEYDTFEDKPDHKLWVDPQRKRIMILQEYFIHEGVWHEVFFCKGDFLQEPKVSPYLDEDGEPECPIKLQSCFGDRNGNRYGAVRAYIDTQDSINKHHSKALHILNSNQTIAEEGAIIDPNEFKREKNKPDGHMTVLPGALRDKRFEFVDQQTELATHFQFLQDSKAEIDAVGANAALTGKQESNASGRALQARQQGGEIEIGVIYDRHSMWERRIYRSVWARIKQFWDQEKWIRVTDDEESLKFVGLNIPVTLGDQIQEHAKETGQEIPQEFLNDPRLNQVVEIRNNVAEIDVDIILESSEDNVTLQHEAFQAFAQAVQASGEPVPLETWLELYPNMPRKKHVMDKLKGDEEQARANVEKQQIAEQIQLQNADAEIKDKQASIREKLAKAGKTEQEAIQKILENAVIQQHQPPPEIII